MCFTLFYCLCTIEIKKKITETLEIEKKLYLYVFAMPLLNICERFEPISSPKKYCMHYNFLIMQNDSIEGLSHRHHHL